MAVLYFAEEDARLWLRMQVACQASVPCEQLSAEALASNVRPCDKCSRKNLKVV